jgi:7,8-dihydro-6-hydroxymethylpterin dimethyltransferase
MLDIINNLWSTAGEIPDSEKIIHALKRAAYEIFTHPGSATRSAVIASERQAKSIFIHHYMDAYNFDLARITKCCHHYPQAGSRLMPICSYNLFHRPGGTPACS